MGRGVELGVFEAGAAQGGDPAGEVEGLVGGGDGDDEFDGDEFLGLGSGFERGGLRFDGAVVEAGPGGDAEQGEEDEDGEEDQQFSHGRASEIWAWERGRVARATAARMLSCGGGVVHGIRA